MKNNPFSRFFRKCASCGSATANGWCHIKDTVIVRCSECPIEDVPFERLDIYKEDVTQKAYDDDEVPCYEDTKDVEL